MPNALLRSSLTSCSNMLEVRLSIPADQASAATWIQAQTDPAIVADALQLCEAAYNALCRGVCSTESERIISAHDDQIHRLQSELTWERDRAASSESKLRDAFEARLQAERERAARQSEDSNALLAEVQSELRLLREKQKVEREELLSSTAQQQKAERAALLQKLAAAEAAAASSALAAAVKAKQERDQALIEKDNLLDALRLEKKALTEQLCAESRERQSAIASCTEQLEERLKRDADRREAELSASIETLQTALKAAKASEATAREEVRQQFLDCLREKDKDHRQALEELRGSKAETTEWLREELAQRTRTLETTLAAKDAAAADFGKRIEALAAENREIVSSLSGSSTAKGKVGERLVETTFAKMQLGSWQDDSSMQAEGFADALWEYTPAGCGAKMEAIVEVKNVATLNSVKDIKKWLNDLRAAVGCGRANAGMFFSLSSRYPGTRPLHLCTLYGVPVCIASRAADDPTPASAMVELAFHAMAELWPLVCKQGSQADVESTVLAVADQLDKQLLDIESMSKKVAHIAKFAASIQTNVRGLEKLRDEMVKDITKLRQRYPALCPDTSHSGDDEAPTREDCKRVAAPSPEEKRDEDVWTSPGGQAFLAAVVAFRDKSSRKRYPQSLAAMDEILQASSAALDFTNSGADRGTLLDLAVARLKKEASTAANRAKRRRVDTPEGGDDVSDAEDGVDRNSENRPVDA